VELRDLRYFVAVAAERNLSRAAKRLHVAQPGVSRQMRNLERELGAALLVRHAKGVTLTLAGEAVARGATELLDSLSRAIDRAEDVRDGRRGRVVLGAMLAAIAAGLPADVREALRRDRPDIDLVVQDFDPPDIDEQVLDGGVDAAVSFSAAPPDPRLHTAPLWSEALAHACVPADHPLGSRRRLTVPDLGELPLVIPQRSFSAQFIERILSALRALGLRSPILVLDGDLRAAHLAVASGRGWIPLARVRASAPPPGTVAILLHGFLIHVNAVALWRRGERRPVVRTVLEAVLAAARRHPAQCVSSDQPLPPETVPRGPPRRLPGFLPPGLELRHLRALLEVAATQTIGRAAERLGVTQSALSRQLTELEDMLALPLLERSPRGATLAPAGTSLAADCPAVLQSLDRLVRETRRARRGMEGRCVLGAVATAAASELLGRVLVVCTSRHPHLHISVEDMETPRQPRALERGDIDLGLAHAYPALPAETSLRRERVYEDRLAAALLSASHELGHRKRLRASDLADVPFLFMARGFHPQFYDRALAALRQIGLTPRVEATYDGLQVVWSLAAQGKGWAFGFRSHIAHPPAGTVAIPVEGLDLPWGLDLLRRRVEPSLAVRSVAQVIREIARAGAGAARRRASRGRGAATKARAGSIGQRATT